MSYLPSKKIGLALFFVVVLFVVIFVAPREKEEVGDNGSIGIVSRENINRIAEKDTDGDGLADWEESLWKTDIFNPDSDNDGTPDGEEIKLGRDPNLGGPDDLLPKNKSNNRENIIGENEKITSTERFGRELFSGYIELINNDRYEGQQADLLYNLLNQNISEIEGSDSYSLSDIRTFNSQSNASIRNYGNNLIVNLGGAKNKNEMATIVSLVETESEDSKKELQEIIDLNKKILEKTLNLPAPKEAEKLHLDFVNSHNEVIESLVKISKISEDPLLSIVGIGEYSQATEKFSQIFLSLKEYFYVKGVVFSKSEPGFVLNK